MRWQQKKMESAVVEAEVVEEKTADTDEAPEAEIAETEPEAAEVSDTAETESPEAEDVVDVEENLEETGEFPVDELAEELVNTVETEDAEAVDLQVPEGATKEIPVEAVKEKLGEVDFSEVLAQELEDIAEPQKEDSHIKRVTASVEADTQHSAHAFQTAVEGLMRHHLTEEEHRRLFTYFAPIPGMSQQINEALDTAQESACAKTSCTGNIIVTGREGSGKTRLSEGLIKALCKERQMEGARVAFLTAEQLNKKDPAAVVNTLAGGFVGSGKCRKIKQPDHRKPVKGNGI